MIRKGTNILSRSGNLDENLAKLRTQLWISRGRRSRPFGYALVGVSLPMFLLAYLTNYLVFEITSILALFLGMTLIFTGLEVHVRSRPANMIAKSPLITLTDLIRKDGFDGNAVYYYDGNRQPHVKIRGRGDSELILTPVGNDLMNLYSDEIGSLEDKGLDYLREWIPRILRESLRLSDQVYFDHKDEDVTVSLVKPSFEMLCLSPELKKGICDKIGCQVQGSIAQAIADGTGSAVRFSGCIYDSAARKSVASFKMLSKS